MGMMDLLYIITLSATVILGKYHSNHSFGFPILLILSMIFHLPIFTVKLASLINSNKDLLPKIKSTLYALHFLLFIIYFICSLCQVIHISIDHVTAWMILSSWILTMTNLHDLPETSYHVQLFLNVLKEILKFILIFLSVLVGFSLSLFTILAENRSKGTQWFNPHNSFLKLLSFMAGEINFDATFLDDLVQVQGTVQILFIIIFIILNIVMINIMIGLTLTSLHNTMVMEDQIKYVRTMLINQKIDLLLSLFKKWKRKLNLFKYRCCWNLLDGFLHKEIILKNTYAEDRKNLSLLQKLALKNPEKCKKVSVGVFVANKVTEDIVETKSKLPNSIYYECEDILEARRLKCEEELAAEAEKRQEDGECYTSLCGDSDNQYEEIQTESRFEGLKSIKELLLKELKRDLLKLIKLDKVYSEVKKKPAKSVNVRPGLALGVITLQAGARGLSQFNIDQENEK